MKNYNPQTVYDFHIEIKVYEKYFKKYSKQMKLLKYQNTTWDDRYLLWQYINSIENKLPKLYKAYLKLLNQSIKPKITLIYQSKMNKY